MGRVPGGAGKRLPPGDDVCVQGAGAGRLGQEGAAHQPHRGHQRHRHDGVGVPAVLSRGSRRAGRGGDCLGRHRQVRLLRGARRRLFPSGVPLRCGAGAAAHLHRLQLGGPHRPRGRAQAAGAGCLERRHQPGDGVQEPVPLRRGVQVAGGGHGVGALHGGERGGALGAGRHHRAGARHWSGEPAGVGHDCGGDVARVHGDVHPVLRHGPLRRHRGVPVPPRSAYHPDEERAADPDWVLGAQQAPRASRVLVPGPARRSADHDPQRSVAPEGERRPGGRGRHAAVAELRAREAERASFHAGVRGPRGPRGGVRPLQDALRPAPHAGWGEGRRGQLEEWAL
mmetsp:Transcript_44155/g.82538  ORF Transcript_44155/g.82538 Transcript_44155/m.82538 type:complete len:340 (+) Transcript_44155:2023-3042(+)